MDDLRPHTTVVLGMSADGKITDKKGSAARFGSIFDKTHLEEQISLVDGVIFGAGTLRSYGTSLPITNPQLIHSRKELGQSLQPPHILVSGSAKVDSQLRFFEQPIPRWLLTTEHGASLWPENRYFSRILVGETENSRFVWEKILPELKTLGMNKLAILGGGQLVASLLAASVIDEIWLTVCPLILGGVMAPTPVEGAGWLQSEGIELDLLEVKQVEGEVFLHYRVVR